MPTSRVQGVSSIAPAECWTLLSSTDIGRLAINTGDGVDLFPVNYLVKDQQVFFSSAPGTKLRELTQHPNVAFEADGTLDQHRWSVVVHGVAARLSFDSEIEESGVLQLATMTPVDKWNYVRITPTSVSGRRFRAT